MMKPPTYRRQRVKAAGPMETVEDVLAWLAGLEANARTVNDGEGLPLAERCVQAQAVIKRLGTRKP